MLSILSLRGFRHIEQTFIISHKTSFTRNSSKVALSARIQPIVNNFQNEKVQYGVIGEQGGRKYYHVCRSLGSLAHGTNGFTDPGFDPGF